MRIAIFGASSQIAKDLILSFANRGPFELILYVRNLQVSSQWVEKSDLISFCTLQHYDQYGKLPHDVVINFVGVGDPKRALDMGRSILDITSYFDDKILEQLEKYPDRRYIFLSSGAVYGNNFSKPVTINSESHILINQITTQDYYSIAKMNAEVKHRARSENSIIDLRVFNYFSRTQDLEARFLITDIVRSIRNKKIFITSSLNIVRDYLHPEDFYQLIECIITGPKLNCSIDCYSKETIDKYSLLEVMNKKFELKFEMHDIPASLPFNATGTKTYYYSLNRKAEEINYFPNYSSLKGILKETKAILNL
jgi:nucleoside-diphosphate-sugar epimerase